MVQGPEETAQEMRLPGNTPAVHAHTGTLGWSHSTASPEHSGESSEGQVAMTAARAGAAAACGVQAVPFHRGRDSGLRSEVATEGCWEGGFVGGEGWHGCGVREEAAVSRGLK